MLSCPTSETRNQPRITWVRTSFVHEDIKLTVTTKFCVSIPRRHCLGIIRWLGVAPRKIPPIVPASAPALASPHVHSTKHRHPVVAVVLLLLESTRQFPAALPEEGSVCLKSPDQGFFAFQSPQQLIEASLHKDPLAHQFPLKFEQTHRQ